MATGGVMDPISDYRVQELSEEQMARAVEVAHRAGKKVMAHAEGTEGIKAAVRAGVDSIEHGTMLDEEGAALMEQKGMRSLSPRSTVSSTTSRPEHRWAAVHAAWPRASPSSPRRLQPSP